MAVNEKDSKAVLENMGLGHLILERYIPVIDSTLPCELEGDKVSEERFNTFLRNEQNDVLKSIQKELKQANGILHDYSFIQDLFTSYIEYKRSRFFYRFGQWILRKMNYRNSKLYARGFRIWGSQGRIYHDSRT